MISPALLARYRRDFAAGRIMHLAAFAKDLEASGTLVHFDWAAFHDEGTRLLADPEAIARLSRDDTRKLLTYVVRMNRYKPGFLAALIRTKGWDVLLERLEKTWL